jgi:hypothetical protein
MNSKKSIHYSSRQIEDPLFQQLALHKGYQKNISYYPNNNNNIEMSSQSNINTPNSQINDDGKYNCNITSARINKQNNTANHIEIKSTSNFLENDNFNNKNMLNNLMLAKQSINKKIDLNNKKVNVNNQNNIKCTQMAYNEQNYNNNNNSYRDYNSGSSSNNGNSSNESSNNHNSGSSNSGFSNNNSGDNNNHNNNNNNNNIDFTKSKNVTERPKTLKSSEEIMKKYFKNHTLHKDFLEQYSIMEELGEGGYGFVLSCSRKEDGMKVAVKFIIREKVPVACWVRNSDLGMIPQEIHILRMINHKNIIKFIDYFEDDKYFYLVQELHGTFWADNLNIPEIDNYSTGSEYYENSTNDINHKEHYYDNKNPLPTPPFYDQSVPSKPYYVNPLIMDISSRRDLDPKYTLKSLTIQEIEEIEMKEKSMISSGTPSIPVKGSRKLTNTSFSSSFSSTSSSPINYYSSFSSSNYQNINMDMSSPLPSPISIKKECNNKNQQLELPRSMSPYIPTVNQRPVKNLNKSRSLQKKPSMDLFECIERHPQLEESRVKYIMRQVVECVYYLINTCSVVHRDLKDENIVIDENYNIKIIDFGSAIILPRNRKNRLFSQFNGTIQYASPEIIRGEMYSAIAQEIWSLGILMYMLLCEGEHPFGDANNVVNKPLVINRQCSPECIDLLYRMLDKNPNHRININDVYNHPWFKD